VPGPVNVGSPVLTPRSDDIDLRGQVDHSLLPGDSVPDRRWIGHIGQHLRQAESGRSPLQNGDLVAA